MSASCPGCGFACERYHGHYWRSLGDLPCFGRPVVLLVRVRRFRCDNETCPRHTFGEPLPEIARPRARHTERLRTMHQGIGLALGGSPGARLAAKMAMPVSGTTLLHRIRQVDKTPPAPPRVLGVDDWAWRKGCSYGTILCDLERRRVLDLLPDRTAESLAAWLKQYPSIAIVVRDRAGAYAEGTRQGAPEAIQVADRWHLLCNGSDALRDLLNQHHHNLRQAAQAVATAPSPPPAGEAPVAPPVAPEAPAQTKAQARSQASLQRREARFAEAVRLREQGLSIRAVARALGVERKTVRRWLRAGHAPTWRHADRGRSVLDPFRDHLEVRWSQGCRNAAALWRELRELGFPGQPTVVRQWATRRRRDDPPAGEMSVAKPTPSMTLLPPTPRKAARLLMSPADTLTEEDRRFVTALLDLSAPVAQAVDLAKRFSEMVRTKRADDLDAWIDAAESGGFKGLAGSLRQDRDAVHAALTEPWSTGPVEGHINRLKVIKRTMYGRAGFDLLRSRVLAAA